MVSWRMIAADVGDSWVGEFDPELAGGTLAGVADGDLDAEIVDVAGQLAEHERPVMLRPNWEMNAPWYPWGAYERPDEGGARPGNSPLDYRDAWIRAHVILDGGTTEEIDARLDDQGLEPLSDEVAVEEVPVADDLAWVWAPVDGPARPQQQPHRTSDYYPGDEWVDWVGIDWYQYGAETVEYQTSGRSTDDDPLAPMDAFYEKYAVDHGKPMAITEWGLSAEPRGTGDDPEWMADALGWIEDHPQVKALVYFERDAAVGDHRLVIHPESAEVFREEVAGGRWLQDPSEPVRLPEEHGGATQGALLVALLAVVLVVAALVGRRAGRGRRPPRARAGARGGDPGPTAGPGPGTP